MNNSDTIALSLDEAAALLAEAERLWHVGPCAMTDRAAFDANFARFRDMHDIVQTFLPEMTTAERAMASGDVFAWTDSPWFAGLSEHDRCFVRGCNSRAGSDALLAAAIRSGQTDDELRALLGRAFGICGGGPGFDYRGGKNPRLIVALAAMDASGFESRHVSAYFVRRRAKGGVAGNGPKTQAITYRRFPKLALVVDTRTHLALSFVPGVGPGPDHPHFERALFEAWRRVPGSIGKLAADAGYDPERAHETARRDMGVRTLIPALTGRPTAKPPSGCWRRRMARLLRTKRGRRRSGYTQRWQSETVNSMMKRNQGSALRARGRRTQDRELALRVPATLVVQASRVHADCSRLTAGLHTAGYPKEMGALRQAGDLLVPEPLHAPKQKHRPVHERQLTHRLGEPPARPVPVQR